MSGSEKAAFITHGAEAWARVIVKRPGTVLIALLALGAVATWATLHLTIEKDQLKLISQDLPEVKQVQKVIDMVGGAGYLMMGLRGDDVATIKKLSDALNERLLAEKENVRFVTYKVPVEFIQENMVLFLDPNDLLEGKKRITAYLKDQLRRNNPFFIEIRKTEPVKLDLKDLIDKYASVGKKSIRDDYYISDDQKMVLMLIKPMWNSTELGKTVDYIQHLTGGAEPGQPPKPGSVLADVEAKTGLTLIEDYEKMGDKKTVYFGFTGSYKTGVDDSYAIDDSLKRVFPWAFGLIVFVTIVFFRKIAPTVIVISGMTLGTVLVMGFAKATLGELNMVTSLIGAILMGFGVDYGIHFVYRTRIELGTGKRYDEAISAALVNAGRPAFIAAIVTGGSFLVLLISGFRGFSQFGFLAGFGTLIIGFTLFSWSPAILSLIGRWRPDLPAKLIGTMTPLGLSKAGDEINIPRPRLMLTAAGAIVALICLASVPKEGAPPPAAAAADASKTGIGAGAKSSTAAETHLEDVCSGKGSRANIGGKLPSLAQRFMGGVRFNYNTRALVAEDRPSFLLQDEINCRFNISSDPIAVPVKTQEEAKEVWDELTLHPSRYPTVDQVVSVYSFIPPAERAAKNAAILETWRKECLSGCDGDEPVTLENIDVASLPPELQDRADLFKRILQKKPYGLEGVPEVYASQFTHLPTTKPENHGFLLFIYPGIDLWDGAKMLQFSEEVALIHTASGHEYRAAGLAILYATLAKIVLHDARWTVLLAAIWILLMHYLDFRSVPLAAASVIPLGIGLWMMLGLMALTPDAFFGRLNFMNLVILPILLGFGVSHGLYLLHRFLEGTSPVVALRSVGAAVASSTLTAIAGFASLFFASHKGLQSIGYVACLGLMTTLVVSFTVLAAVLQIIYDRKRAREPVAEPAKPGDAAPAK